MNGKMLTQQFLDFCDVREVSDDYLSQRRIYEALDMAAGIFCRETRPIRNEATITTVMSQQTYDLPPDFIDLHMKNARGRYFARYYDGTNYSWPVLAAYERLYRDNLTTSQETPNRFAIVNKGAAAASVTGSATAAGPVVVGKSILTDSTRNFLTTYKVFPRDIIANLTDGSLGYVIEVIDATRLYTALFDGTDNDWSLSDLYKIQPATEKEIVLEAPAATAGHVMSLPYAGMPNPVFSEYDAWPFPSRTCRAIASGAAAIFKMDKTQYVESKALGGHFNEEIRRLKVERGRQRLQEGPSRLRERLL